MSRNVTELSLNRKKYLQEYKLNNNKRSLELLILTYIPIVEKIAKKYINKGIEYEDLVSIGTLHLIEFFNSHEITNNLDAYIYTELNRIYIQEISKIDDSLSYEEYLSKHKNGEDETYYDDLLEEALKLYSTEVINEALNYRLNERQRLVLNLRYGLNENFEHTIKEIASILGISVKNTRKIENNSLKLLRMYKSVKKLEDFID